jgi:hypothetical protein
MKVVQLEGGEVAVVMETDADKEWVLTLWGRTTVYSYSNVYGELREYLPRTEFTSFEDDERFEKNWGVQQ